MDLKRGDTASGVVPQETTSASGDNASTGDDASTGLDDTSDDHVIPMVCTVCVSCGLVCSVIYHRGFRLTYHEYGECTADKTFA